MIYSKMYNKQSDRVSPTNAFDFEGEYLPLPNFQSMNLFSIGSDSNLEVSNIETDKLKDMSEETFSSLVERSYLTQIIFVYHNDIDKVIKITNKDMSKKFFIALKEYYKKNLK